jgi:uncharacterized protein YndB with AHSA1/START domain
MVKEAQDTTVRVQVEVEASIDQAFAVFTEGLGTWFPPEYNLLAVPIAERVIEPRAGGRLYDRGIDGSECQWGRVLVYEPPTRIAFTWDISTQWQIETDRSRTSEVDVRFVAETPARTRVELTHRHLERHGDGWQQLRDVLGNANGWPGCLRRYVERVAQG